MYQQLTLAAGVGVEFSEVGDFLRILDGAQADLTIQFYSGGRIIAEAQNVGAGYSERAPQTFDRIRLTSAAGGAFAFVLRLGNTVGYDAPPTGNVTVTNQTAMQGAYVRASIAAQDEITPSSLYAPNPARRYVMVQNNDATKYLRLRLDGDPTSAIGIRIAPGGYWESSPGFAPTGAVKVIAEAAGGIAVEALEG